MLIMSEDIGKVDGPKLALVLTVLLWERALMGKAITQKRLVNSRLLQGDLDGWAVLDVYNGIFYFFFL